ncbi:hypothetical protein B0H11DRAFT_1933943 [Mycena galericulata]|nr:hypothetical protein B0H11DRAFT_1933943 [Mycena galericulata]
MRIARQVICDASWIGFSSLPAFPNFNDKRCIRSTASGPKFSGAFNRQVNRGTSAGFRCGSDVTSRGVYVWDTPYNRQIEMPTLLYDSEDNRIYARPSRFRGTSILHSVQLSFRTHRVRQMMQVKSNLPGRNPSIRNARANSDDTRFYVAFRFATSGLRRTESFLKTSSQRFTQQLADWDVSSSISTGVVQRGVRTAAEIEIGIRVLRCTVHEFDWSASGKRMRPGSKFDSSSFDSYNVCKCIRFTTSGLKFNQTFNMQANRAIEQTGRSSMVHRALSASLEIIARKSVLDSLR